MAKIKILAGDFPKCTADIGSNLISFPWAPGDGFSGKRISLSELEEADIATEESIKRVGGTVGWGAAGAVLLGPVGLLAGLLLGGKKTEITFVAKFKDGRKMLATTDSKSYKAIMAGAFR